MTVDVLVSVDVHCRPWSPNPTYRLYVNDELFAERTWIWHDVYLEELIPISAPPGDYLIKYQVIPPESATIKLKNFRVVETNGQVQLIKNTLRIKQ